MHAFYSQKILKSKKQTDLFILFLNSLFNKTQFKTRIHLNNSKIGLKNELDIGKKRKLKIKKKTFYNFYN